jgi:hypothetical protein
MRAFTPGGMPPPPFRVNGYSVGSLWPTSNHLSHVAPRPTITLWPSSKSTSRSPLRVLHAVPISGTVACSCDDERDGCCCCCSCCGCSGCSVAALTAAATTAAAGVGDAAGAAVCDNCCCCGGGWCCNSVALRCSEWGSDTCCCCCCCSVAKLSFAACVRLQLQLLLLLL